MQKINLACTKSGPYEFYGEKIATAISNVVNNRWHEISVFGDSEGKYVLSVSYRTKEENEVGADFVEVFDRLFSLDAKLNMEESSYIPIIPDKNEEFIRRTYIPLKASFSAACSKLSKDLSHMIKAEVSKELNK